MVNELGLQETIAVLLVGVRLYGVVYPVGAALLHQPRVGGNF